MKNRRQKKRDDNFSFRPVVRYIIWFYVAVLIAEILVGALFAMHSMKKEGDFVVNSTQSQIEYRVNNTITLLTYLANDKEFSDPSTSYQEKAAALTKYSDAFGYMMICIVDKDVNVWDEEGTDANLGSRSYMQKLFSTGELQITDSFAAGVDGVTLNYTIAVPIMKDGKVDGCLFAAIYFDEIEQRLESNCYGTYQKLSLYGESNQVMSMPKEAQYGKAYLELMQDSKVFGSTVKQVEENMYNKGSGSYWYLLKGDLTYASYVPIAHTGWTLMCTLDFWRTISQFIPQILGMMLISTIACIFLVLRSNRYIRSQMGTVDMLVTSVQELEKKIYQNEKPDNVDFKEIISLTSKGLTDGLTGVITRTVFLNQVPNKIMSLEEHQLSAMCFIDIDNLKIINDTYGHDVGDMSLKNVGYVLREYEKKYDGLVARYGGDEFIMLLTGFDSRESMEDILEELTLRLHSQVSTGDTIIPIQCSIGVSICTSRDEDVEQLIKESDETLYFVKQSGKGRYQIYEK